MDAESVMALFNDKGWSDYTKMLYCLEYIENQKSNDTFREFLEEKPASPRKARKVIG